MIKLFLRAIVVSVVAGLGLAALLSLAPRVAPVIDTIPQATSSSAPAPIGAPAILMPMAEKILGRPVRI